MKTTSRKRLLISSVAMLLVAMLALGTATFAWFTSSTTVTAKGLNAKTVKSSKLVISDHTKNWGQEIDYGQNDVTFRPASSADGVNWFRADAAKFDNYAKPADVDFEPINTSLGSYVFTEEFNVANAGEADVDDVTITVSGLKNNYARIALVEVTSDGQAVSGKTFANSIIDNAGVAYFAVKTAKTTESITPTTNTKISVGPLKGKVGKADIGGAKYYKLYVWFEGQDEQCTDGNAGQSIGDIQISVSGTTVVE